MRLWIGLSLSQLPLEVFTLGACPSLPGEVTVCEKSARPVFAPFIKPSRLCKPSALATCAPFPAIERAGLFDYEPYDILTGNDVPCSDSR